jgi:hypothetical protein
MKSKILPGLSLFWVLFFMFCFLSTDVHANVTYWVDPSSESKVTALNVSQGETIHLLLKAEVPANKVLGAYKCKITYDLTLASLLEAKKPDDYLLEGITINKNVPGEIILNGYITAGISGPASVSLLDLTLIAQNTEGTFTLDIQAIKFGFSSTDEFIPHPEKAAITISPITISPEPNPVCVEQDSGTLDIEGSKGKMGQEAHVLVKIKAAPGTVSSLGFDVTYDPSVLEYSNYERGDLVKLFDMFGVDPVTPGKLRIGGISSENGIQKGASGYVVQLKFKVKGGQESNCYSLQMGRLLDDFAHFSPTGGCFCIQKSCDGDLNKDGNLTPADALIAFKCYLGNECPDCTDVNEDGAVTPADALCLFKKYLGQPSCLN